MSLVGPRPERPEFVQSADAADSVLRPAPRGPARAHRLGAGALHLRRQRRGRDGEAAVRPLLHQEPVDRARPLHHLSTIKTVILRQGCVTRCDADAVGLPQVVNAMTDRRRGLLPRQRLRRRRAAHSLGSDGEPRVPQHRAAARDLRRVRIQATFFVLGWVAERFPELVARDRGRGARDRLARLRASAGLRPDAAAVPRGRPAGEGPARDRGGRLPVIGYRAPSYSITPRSLWALDVLIEEGYPLRRQHLPDPATIATAFPISPRHPYVLRTATWRARRSAGVHDVRWATLNLPIGGGGYFRILPYAWTRWGISRAESPSSRRRRSSTCTRGRSTPTSRVCGGPAEPVPPLPQPGRDRTPFAAVVRGFQIRPDGGGAGSF